ncbi:LCP family protein [Nostocoides sp. HKS02]|uniref:LCP family protein n=1 Tax=Nostocoides sp. HKS02 TaxID=1813880 RepID=UPI001E4EAE74|nr:LCP family protein [Tetrasphaera sp. HKS02]
MSEPTHGSAEGEDATTQASAVTGDDATGDQPQRRSDRHTGADHPHPWLRRVVFGIAAFLVVLLVLGIGVYLKLTGNINRIDISGALGRRPSPAATTDAVTNLAPMNVFVMGSDTRAGQGGNFGADISKAGVEGARSDTNLIVHLSADRKSAIVVSIPRDSMTMAPRDCKNKSDTVQNGVMRQWNANFTLGGPACTIRTFEGLTNIYINHYVVIDFRGFQSMVDALGGVTVCTPQAVNDPGSGLKLPAGRTKVNGQQALSYVRARETLGDGSDLSRIDRQQAFLSSMIQGATQSSLLLRPDKLFRFLDAATQATTTDMGIGDMKDLAESVRSIGISQIRFVRLPTEPYVADPNRVQWTASAQTLWQAIREDKPLPGTKAPAGSTKPTPSPTTTQPLTVSPGVISVRVTNDSGVPGMAKQAAAALRVQGFTVVSYLTGSGPVSHGVVVRYGPGRAEAARTVAAVYPGAQTREDPLLGSTIELSMGIGSPAAVAVPNRLGTEPLPKESVTATQAPTPTPSIKARAANQDICS